MEIDVFRPWKVVENSEEMSEFSCCRNVNMLLIWPKSLIVLYLVKI